MLARRVHVSTRRVKCNGIRRFLGRSHRFDRAFRMSGRRADEGIRPLPSRGPT